MTSSNLQIFIAELIGTFVLVVFATGSIVYDVQTGGTLGIAFAAIAPFIALIIVIYSFRKISLANFNPAVTIGFYITGHISKIQIIWYFTAQIIGALLGSIFVMNFIGTEANLGVYSKGLKGLGVIAIGGIVGLDIFFLATISGASMNPARALAPALFSRVLDYLWLYWTAPFVGTMITAFLFRKKFRSK
jgi:aquaporin Z